MREKAKPASARKAKPDASPFGLLEPKTKDFYLRALNLLDTLGISYAVGGAYSMAAYAGIIRHTKDLDVFVKREQAQRVIDGFTRAGYQTAWTHPHWIAKAFSPDGEDYVDVIYGAGNGISEVDDEWLSHGVIGEVLGHKVRLCPAEEIIWSKSFVCERERYDGADVAHLLRVSIDTLDWERLYRRFTGHEAVLLSHLILFGYIYPHDRHRVPRRVIDELLLRSSQAPDPNVKLCRGPNFSYGQYLVDINEWGYVDARLQPHGNMSPQEIEHWTHAPK